MFWRMNMTGIPDRMKRGVEGISGYSFDNVRVSYRSPVPSELGASALTRQNRIYIAPGQESALPHELWHVVQQASGRVRANTALFANQINDSPALEHEADVFAARIVGAMDGATQDTALRVALPVPASCVQFKNKKRLEYLGATPNRQSPTGRAVVSRMIDEGRIFIDVPVPKQPPSTEYDPDFFTFEKMNLHRVVEFDPARANANYFNFYYSYASGYYPVSKADMGHRAAAVIWWDHIGCYYGPKSKLSNIFMNEKDNYELEPSSINSGKGAQLPYRYVNPLLIRAKDFRDPRLIPTGPQADEGVKWCTIQSQIPFTQWVNDYGEFYNLLQNTNQYMSMVPAGGIILLLKWQQNIQILISRFPPLNAVIQLTQHPLFPQQEIAFAIFCRDFHQWANVNFNTVPTEETYAVYLKYYKSGYLGNPVSFYYNQIISHITARQAAQRACQALQAFQAQQASANIRPAAAKRPGFPP